MQLIWWIMLRCFPLQEKQDGVEFHCFDMDSKVQTTEGHIGWDVLDKQPSFTLEESARW